jgi:hypothetical protein
MTLPTIYPANFSGTTTDFTKAKVERSGAMRASVFTVTVPTTTASATVIGLVPVQKGARLVLPACRITADSLGSNSETTKVGIVYDDTTNNTSSPAVYVATGDTTVQAGGTYTLLTTDAADSYVCTGNGWVAITTEAAATTAQGTIHGVITITYDQKLQ